jgi:chemotaxis protein MotB
MTISVRIGRWFAAFSLPLCVLVLAGCGVIDGGSDQAQLQQAQARNRQLQAENAALQSQLAQQQQQNLYTVAADLLFASGSFDITPKGRAALDDIAGKLRGLKNSKIVVYGYTDNAKLGEGLMKMGLKTNVDLSSRRADAVVNYLRAQGINPDIIAAKGRGETHPVGPNNTAAGRAQNRRIEIAVEGPGN